MTTMNLNRVRKSTTRGVLGAAILVAGLLAFPAAAKADDHGHGHGHGNGHGNGNAYGHSDRDDHGYWHGDYRAHPRPAYYAYPTVPRVIVPGAAVYRPYYAGPVYYGPHHHMHVTYRFPVFVNGVVTYRPYTYCGDDLFVPPVVVGPAYVAAPPPVVQPLPHLAIGFSFGSPNLAVGGTYIGH
jgi:hypothetical protein